MAWLQSKTGSELMTVSSDGQVLWWDIRKLAEPLENLLLKVSPAPPALLLLIHGHARRQCPNMALRHARQTSSMHMAMSWTASSLLLPHAWRACRSGAGRP